MMMQGKLPLDIPVSNTLKCICKELQDHLKEPSHHSCLTGVSAAIPGRNSDLDAVPIFKPKASKLAEGEDMGEEGAGGSFFTARYELCGDPDTALEGARWEMEVAFPEDYPLGAPNCHFTSPCFHPDVPALPSDDDNAAVAAQMHARVTRARDQVIEQFGGGADAATGGGGPAAAERVRSRVCCTAVVVFQELLGEDEDKRSWEVDLAYSDTPSDAGTRFWRATQIDRSWQLVYKGAPWQEGTTLEALGGLVDGSVVNVVWGMDALPCGPFAAVEGKCSACRDLHLFWSPALTVQKMLMDLQARILAYPDMSSSMLGDANAAVASLRMATFNAYQDKNKQNEAEGKWLTAEEKWSPWVATLDSKPAGESTREQVKVRNLYAAALLAGVRLAAVSQKSDMAALLARMDALQKRLDGQDHAQDFRQVNRFVATSLGPGIQTPWQQVRCIGLKHESIKRNLAHYLLQLSSASLITNPARYSDVQPEVQVLF